MSKKRKKHQSHGTKETGQTKPRFRRGTIREEGMWRWKWPKDGNCWETHSTPMQGAPKTCFTSTGPSKRTVSRRAARRQGRN